MIVYSYADARQKLAALLELALTEGQVKLRNRDGRIFVIRPERVVKASPFDVRSVKLPITKMDILNAVRESRERF
jgi:hypothetical protein